MMSDKMGTKYAQNARFVGRRSVTGPLNDFSLAHLVSDLRSEARKNNQSQEELRCNLEFSDKNLLITYIKKDEGFESDGESTKSAEAVKIVLNSTHDDTSSANSSACSDSDDLAVKSASTSASASPTADLAKYKFDHKESYNINDVLICHTAQSSIVWVIRAKDGLEATVVECTSEDEVKHLYKKFLDVSKRSKLERHRRRKSDGGSVVARSMEAIFNNKNNLMEDDLNSMRFSLLQHTDRNGITHIEVEQPKSYVEHAVMGPSQQLVAKLRSSRSTATKKPASEKSKFAKELESILSKELETRKSYFSAKTTRPPGESLSLRQRAPALLLRKLDEFEEKANQMWAKAEAEAQAKAALQRTDDGEEENRKVWNKPTVVIDSTKLSSRTPPPRMKQASHRVERDYQRKERLNRIKAELLNEIRPAPSTVNTSSTTSIANNESSGSYTTVTSSTPAALSTPSVGKKEEKQILVPTKTGKEPVKKLYPKDQVAPEFLHHNRPTPLNAPPPGGPRFMLALPSPMQFTAQPHSLPIYPVNMAPIPVWARYGPSSMAPPSGDFNDTNNNMGHIWAALPVQRMAPPSGGAGESGRGRSRDRSKLGIDPDQRRRAQSKSPARIESSSKDSSINNVSGGLTRKFREFGDAFRQRISRKAGAANISVNSGCNPDAVDGGQLLKSNLKKKNDESATAGNVVEITNTAAANNDNKKVHFNKFATVQMME